HALGTWGAPYLADAPDTDAFRSHWLELPLGRLLTDHTPDAPPVTIEVRTGDQPVIVEVTGGEIRVRPGTATNPHATISGPHRPILQFLAGRTDLQTARAEGMHLDGDPATLDRVRATPRVRS